MERDRIVLLRESHEHFGDDLQYITADSSFLFMQERDLENTLLTAFCELRYIVNHYRQNYKSLLSNGVPDLAGYLTEMSVTKFSKNSSIVVEIHSLDLSTDFKSFLLFSKSVLDKLVPLFSYRFNDSLRQFDDKGTRLLQRIKDCKKVPHEAELIALVKQHKSIWIDDLIDLRNNVAHYSHLPEYLNFWVPGELVGTKEFRSLQDFNRPVIRIRGNENDALEYMLSTVQNMREFCRVFLRLCEFTDDRRPKISLRCECGYEIARKIKKGPHRGKLELLVPQIEIEIIDRPRAYGRIPCPQCHRRIDTDLKFWEEQGLINAKKY